MSEAKEDSEQSEPAAVGAALGVVCALLASLPAALRAANESVGLFSLWFGMAAVAAWATGPLVIALRALRPARSRLAALVLGLAASLGPLVLFGTLIKTATNHRPLGATTFAIVGIGLAIGLVALTARLLTWARGSGPMRNVGRAGIGLMLLGSLALTIKPTLTAFGTAETRPWLVDAATLLAACAVASFVSAPSGLTRIASRVGLPLWALLLVAGFFVGSAESRDAAARGAPLLAGPARWGG